MVISIRSIETAVPGVEVKQGEVRDLFLAQPGRSRLAQRLITSAFDSSAIDTRHTVVDELSGSRAAVPPGGTPVFYDAEAGLVLDPSTGTRNALYAERSPELVVTAARRALEAADGIEASDVTHVVTVSCTGFYAPGPDFALVRDLGLSPRTQRYHLGFMGCYAAFPALRAARDFCRSDAGAVVLVVCVELCSVHLQASDDPDTIVASSVFSDGAAAAVVSGRETASGAGGGGVVLDLDAFDTTLTPVGEGDMAWTIGDHGFEMVLSRYVPAIIGEHIHGALAPLLGGDASLVGQPAAAVDLWAVHPGGRSILDKVQHALSLSDAQLEPSRSTLAEHGNMSSATVLFVLQRLLRAGATAPQRVCAMAFGPGLTVESALLTLRPA
ncbi:type III polyketide synthase [Sanguibacter suarezii]|uniref:type III polyketide synthase n=1 Tax=Sanguibacter suarezii TaxID=60921 RepID=UPI0008306707|nr:type III polyketide synthase [Sanguibacter suarezii]